MQTEKEFLAEYKIKDYERPSITADVAAFTIRSEKSGNRKNGSENKLCLLLIRRGRHPFKDHWALPGGFLEPGETVENCALREISEETNITPSSLMPVGVFSEPGRDPRGWIISHAFASIIGEDSINLTEGDDASDAEWFEISFERKADGDFHLLLRHQKTEMEAILSEEHTKFGKTSFKIKDSGKLAFDHAGIIATAVTALRKEAGNLSTICDFMPEKFTLDDFRRIQKTIMNVSILPANFRRKVNEHVVETGEYVRGAGRRPVKLYRKKL